MDPSVGRIVHVQVDGQLRAAMVVRVWSGSCVNLTIFVDGGNDVGKEVCGGMVTQAEAESGSAKRTSVQDTSLQPNGWTWPPRA